MLESAHDHMHHCQKRNCAAEIQHNSVSGNEIQQHTDNAYSLLAILLVVRCNATHIIKSTIVATLTCTTEGFTLALQSFRPFASVLQTVFNLCSTYLHSIVEFVHAVTTGDTVMLHCILSECLHAGSSDTQ